MGAVWVKDHYPLREPRGPLPSGGSFAAMGAVWGQGALPLGLEVEVGDQLGVLLDEFLAGVYLFAHE